MKPILNGTVLAEADKKDVIRIEGNWYFPPASLSEHALENSPTESRCPWRGEAQYFNARLDDGEHQDVAWSFPDPLAGAANRAGQDFANYVAFEPSVEITE